MKTTTRSTSALLCTIFVFAVSSPCFAADWGSLKGRFILEGDAPSMKALTINKDLEVCGKHDLKDETFVVAKDGSLANVVVQLYLKRGKTVDIHPDLEKPSEVPVIDNADCRFSPRIIVARAGFPFILKNSDSVSHNTNGALQKNSAFNTIIAANEEREMDNLKKAESKPVDIKCNIHPWMAGFLIVNEHPYAVVSDEEGNFMIENLPAGKHEFTFWHEGNGNIRDLKLGGEKTSRRGRVKLTIPAGETLDLGDIKVPVKLLK